MPPGGEDICIHLKIVILSKIVNLQGVTPTAVFGLGRVPETITLARPNAKTRVGVTPGSSHLDSKHPNHDRQGVDTLTGKLTEFHADIDLT